ncbi:CidA/LrgA family protein [Shinella sp. NM-101]|uniref:CidA/LrgA family protein n=1 Tax=Shinella sp. NM-101 TaxID=2744455 RepID=UPI001F3EC683|nr:CidA/LrgA family protein [Shinella sp. NM-101]
MIRAQVLAAGRWIVAFAVIFVAWAAGEAIATGLYLPVPAALIGLAMLFVGFRLSPSLVVATEPAGLTLLRQFPLFLYPLGAGFLSLHGLGAMVLLKIVLAVFVSLVLSLVVGVQVFRLFKNKHG